MMVVRVTQMAPKSLADNVAAAKTAAETAGILKCCLVLAQVVRVAGGGLIEAE